VRILWGAAELHSIPDLLRIYSYERKNLRNACRDM
jgi:hypothetical protein